MDESVDLRDSPAPVNIVDAVSTAQSVTSLTLVNAANGTPIASFNPLVSGASPTPTPSPSSVLIPLTATGRCAFSCLGLRKLVSL